MSLACAQIYHPNIDTQGSVCLNILRQDWRPVFNLNSVMIGLLFLFLEPNPDDPLNKGRLRVHVSVVEAASVSQLLAWADAA